MATEYTITYTYTGQDNTSGTRSVSFSKFKASGDTGHTIAQITSIQYIHYHTSTTPMTWNLRGRLVFSDGTTITSPNIGHSISGDVVKYTHTFSTLPTAEQFANLTSVQTLDSQGKTTSGGYSSKLYWRANSSYPMQLIVKFIEVPPVVYAPSVSSFQLVRYNENGVRDEEGQYIATTLKLAIADTSGLTGAQCRIYYSANTYPNVGTSQYVDVTSKISTLINGVTFDTSILTGVWGIGYVWNFAVVFIAGEENGLATASVARGSTSLHISGEPGGGVCVGGFGSGTTANPKFESAVPAYFYAGINGVTNYSTEEVATGGKWVDGKPIYRKVIRVDITSLNINYTVTNIGVNVDSLVSIGGVLIRDGNTQWSPNYYVSDTSYCSVWLNATDGSIRAKTSTAHSGYLVLEYTKVAD